MATGANYKGLGISGLKRYGPYVYEEFLSQLRWPRAGEIYKEMAYNDPVVGSILYMAEMLIRNVKWSVQRASDKSVDIQAADFVNSCMDDMDTSWSDVISEVISMLTYGFSFHEIVYKVRRGPNSGSSKYNSKYTDGRIGWRRMPVRAQSTLYQWVFADDGDIKAFIQLAPPDYKVTVIPLSKGLLFRTRLSRDNPEGISLLRNAYRPWYFKKRIEEVEGIGIERDLAGLPVLTAPEGMDLWDASNPNMVALKNNAETLIKNVRKDSEEGILLPFGWDLELLTTGSSRNFDTSAIINRYDNRIAITMLSDLVLIGGDKTGSFALAETKEDLLASALQSQLGSIADVLNTYAIPNLIQYNSFPGLVEHPRIVPGLIQKANIKELALLLRSMGLNIAGDMVLQNHLRTSTGMPEMSLEIFQEVYKPQMANNTTPKPDTEQPDDTTQNDLEQNDLDYMK